MTLTRAIIILTMFFSAGCARHEPCPFNDAPVVSTISPSGHELDQLIRNKLGQSFSGTVLVEHRGQVLLHAAYGYADPRACIPADPQHAYWIGSLSKQFTATALIKLRDQGRLQLSDRIGDYLPNVQADKAQITVSQLLTHTSGLRNDYSADGFSVREQAISAVLARRLEQVPGHSYYYSNDAYSLAAAVIEIVSGQTFEAFLNEELFIPAGLTETGSAGDGGAWNRLQIAERALGATRVGPPQHWEHDWGFKGGTGVLATASDLRTWFHAVRTAEILTPSSTETLFSTQVTTKRDGLSYAYGWYRLQEPDSDSVVILHTGDDDFIGHSSSLRWRINEKILVIALSNSGYWDDRSVAGLVTEELEELALRLE